MIIYYYQVSALALAISVSRVPVNISFIYAVTAVVKVSSFITAVQVFFKKNIWVNWISKLIKFFDLLVVVGVVVVVVVVVVVGSSE